MRAASTCHLSRSKQFRLGGGIAHETSSLRSYQRSAPCLASGVQLADHLNAALRGSNDLLLSHIFALVFQQVVIRARNRRNPKMKSLKLLPVLYNRLTHEDDRQVDIWYILSCSYPSPSLRCSMDRISPLFSLAQVTQVSYVRTQSPYIRLCVNHAPHMLDSSPLCLSGEANNWPQLRKDTQEQQIAGDLLKGTRQ